MVTSKNASKRSALQVIPGGASARARTEPTDEEIVEAVVRGDTSISDLLYVRLVDTVDVTLYRIFGRREADHEDWVQRAFEQIVLTLSSRSYAGACSLRTWASAVTSRVAFNTLRSRKNERRVIAHGVDSSSDVAANGHGGGRDAEREVAARAELARLRDVLATLKPRHAEAVFLHDVLGHDLAEIAVLEGVTVAAAQSRLVRGRRELYEALGIAQETRKGR
jgi:RNA polymerase sigma-70 factor (ECF subfamily)